MKFRKKPVVIDAVRWMTDNFHEVCDFAGDKIRAGIDGRMLYVDTPEGSMAVSPFDWIIRGIAGEFYPCKPDIFENTYEKVEE